MRKTKNKGTCDEEAKQHCLLGTKVVIYVIQHLQKARILGRVIFRPQQNLIIFIYFFREFQFMVFALDDSSLSSNQDTG